VTGPGLVAQIGGLLDPLTDTVSLGVVIASLADLLRLAAVPAFAWAAWRDVRTRRVPGETWRPLAVLGVVLFAADAWAAWAAVDPVWNRFLLRAGLAVGVVVPLGYLFWRIGGFGGADVKAVMVLALLFPTYPTYVPVGSLSSLPVESLPAVETAVGVFAFTVLTNAVLVGGLYPVGLVVRNAAAGRLSPLMVVGRPVSVDRIPGTYGRLLERPGGHTGRGLDLDALRMYLRWRRASLSELRADPGRFRDPASLPDDPGDPTDGNVRARTDGGGSGEPTGDADRGGSGEPTGEADADGTPAYDDPWGAAAFLEDIDRSAYGTRPDDLRDGLEVLATADDVWVSPGLPFVVPLFAGLVLALTVGDVLFAVLGAVGVV
jgi:preflagellin peptidase FlaK